MCKLRNLFLELTNFMHISIYIHNDFHFISLGHYTNPQNKKKCTVLLFGNELARNMQTLCTISNLCMQFFYVLIYKLYIHNFAVLDDETKKPLFHIQDKTEDDRE